MTKRIIVIAVLACLVLTLLAACGNGNITAEKAQKIVLKDLGVSANQAELHVHTGEFEGKPCYSIYATVDGHTWEYLVDYNSGEILSKTESSHSH